MHCVSENPGTAMNSDQAYSIPGAYPLALSGMGSLRLGALAAAKTKAQRDAEAAARKAAAAQKHAEQLAARQQHQAAVQAQRVAKQEEHKAAVAANQAAHLQKQQEQVQKRVAAQQAAAAKRADHKKGGGTAPNQAASAQVKAWANDVLAKQKAKKASLEKKKADLRAKIAARKGKKLKGLFGFLGSLLGLGDDPGVTVAAIDPTTGLPTNPAPSGGIDPAMMMAMSGGNMDPAMMMAMGGGSGGMDPNMLLIMEMMQTSKGTPPKNCNPNSTRPACVMYYANQQQQQSMMMIVMLIMQMNQQNQQMEAEIMQLLQQLAGGGIPGLPGQGCPPGYALDPSSGQCVPTNAAPLPPPYDPAYGPAISTAPINQEYGMPAVPYEVGPGQALAPLPYAPGGGASVYDPNMPAAYAGMPSPTDPYGDVAAIPPGYSQGSDFGGGGGDFIPTDISVSQGPVFYSEAFSSDVQTLPPGAMDTGSDPFADIAVSESPVYPVAPAGAIQAGPTPGDQVVAASQGVRMPQQQVVSQGAPPSQIIMSAPDEQNPGGIPTQDQDAIMAQFADSMTEVQFG